MSNQPLSYHKTAQHKKVNKTLVSFFDLNFNQLNHPISCRARDARSFTDRPVTKWPLKSIKAQPFFYGFLNEDTNQVEIYDDAVLLMLNYLGNYGNCYFLDNLIGSKFNRFNEKRKQDNNSPQPVSSFSNRLSDPTNLFELNEDTYRHNLHVQTLTESFREYGRLNFDELIDQLYSTNDGDCSRHLNNVKSMDQSSSDLNKSSCDLNKSSCDLKSSNDLNKSSKEDRLRCAKSIDDLLHDSKDKQESLEDKSNDVISDQSINLNRRKVNSFEDTFIGAKNSFNQNFIDREEYILKLDLEEALFIKQVYGILSVQEFVKKNPPSNETEQLDKRKDEFSQQNDHQANVKDEEDAQIRQDDVNQTESEQTDKIDRSNRQTANLNLINLWSKCIKLSQTVNQCFITKYAAYFYFRSKGFIVKNGIKFGSDFVLYSRNPSFVHSTYSVLLVKKSTETEQSLRLVNIQAFVRMTKCVVKVSFVLNRFN